MILTLSTEETTMMTSLLKCFMDGITVLTKTVQADKAVSEKLGDIL